MEFGVLGPLQVRDAHGVTTVEGHRRRALLAVLLAHQGRTVPSTALIDALWPEVPPRTAHHTLHTHVSRLRHLHGVPVEAQDGGYRLDAPAVDAARFEELLARAQELPVTGGVALLEEALALWRGPAYGGAADLPGVRAEARRLETRRLDAREDLVRALVACGRAADAVPLAEALVADEEARESAWALLIRAHVAAGRPADGVAASHRAVRALAELGLDPAADLRTAQAEALQVETGPSRAALAGDKAPGTPVRADPGPVNRLPVTLGSLVGREDDLLAVEDLLGRARLVTLVGPGGVGKTRLALEVLHRTSPGAAVRLVDLAAVRGTSEVAAATVAALGVSAQAGPVASALRQIGRQDLLVLVDNCEHVLDALAEVLEDLLAGGRVRVVATSRERIGLDGEHVHRLEPLSVSGPEPAARRLFLERAAEAGTDIDDLDPDSVDRLVRRLDGLPLAIEMAAARTATTGVHEIEQLLDRSATGLADPRRRAPDRHRTLGALVTWSEQVLDEEQRRVLRAWPVFAGPVELADATALLGTEDDVVEALVARSLLALNPGTGGEPSTYRMLETVRSVVAGSAAADLAARHARHVSRAVTEADVALRGRHEGRAAARLRRLLAEARQAHAWARDQELPCASELTAALHVFAVSTLDDEVLGWAARLVPLLAPETSGAADVSVAARLALAGELTGAGERASAALTRPGEERTHLAALEVLADVALFDGRLEECRTVGETLAERARAAGDAHYVAMGTAASALAMGYEGAVDAGLALVAAARRELTDEAAPSAVGWMDYTEGELLLETAPQDAQDYLRRAVQRADGVGHRYLGGVSRVSLSTVLARHGDPVRAAPAVADVLRWWSARADRTHLLTTLRNTVDLLLRLDAPVEAAELWGAVTGDRVSRSFGAERARLDRAHEVLSGLLPEDELIARVRLGAAREPEEATRAALAALGRPS